MAHLHYERLEERWRTNWEDSIPSETPYRLFELLQGFWYLQPRGKFRADPRSKVPIVHICQHIMNDNLQALNDRPYPEPEILTEHERELNAMSVQVGVVPDHEDSPKPFAVRLLKHIFHAMIAGWAARRLDPINEDLVVPMAIAKLLNMCADDASPKQRLKALCKVYEGSFLHESVQANVLPLITQHL